MANDNGSTVLTSSVPQRGTPPAERVALPIAIAVGLALVATTVVAAGMLRKGPAAAPATESCALPTGTDIRGLSARLQALFTARQLACADHRDGRITLTDYHSRSAALDALIDDALALPAPVLVPTVRWATEVGYASSQYTESSWSAAQALGAPDVPTPGDNANAWAPLAADGGIEALELRYREPAAVSAVEIYENLGAGAITSVELVEPSGARHAVPVRNHQRTGLAPNRNVIEMPCTDYPVAAVRITLDTRTVSGWNEIDAVGLRSCR